MSYLLRRLTTVIPLRFLVRRLLSTLPTLFLIVAISFFLAHVAPGGPFDLEKPLPPEVKANLMRAFHLNDPLWKQFLLYMWDLLHGNFGPSYVMMNFTVGEIFSKSLPVSLELGGAAFVLSLVLGVIMGIIAALRQNRVQDYAVIAVATAGSTVPNYVVAPIIQLVFGLWLKWLPVGGWNNGAFLNTIGPVVTLALPYIAVVARLMRGSMIEALRAHHIRTARAMGLSDYSIIVRHALRGALLPIVSYAGPAAAGLVTGSLIVETIFGIPGIGRYFIDAALNRDYTMVMGTVVVLALFTLAFNFIVDILYAIVDPRVRYE
jgi:oligopeptide transport system permease protein